MEQVIGADERAFRGHMERPDFQIGETKGQWRLIAVNWPHPIITVRAHDGTNWAFRFDLNGYPARLPNARPWDLEANAPLASSCWPQGTGRVAAAFNPNWNAQALYLPCDRLALAGHEQWLVQHPEKAWPSSRGIIHYLEIIHDLLASHQHLAAVRAAA
jgi:hypothetical protein